MPSLASRTLKSSGAIFLTIATLTPWTLNGDLVKRDAGLLHRNGLLNERFEFGVACIGRGRNMLELPRESESDWMASA